MPDDTNSAIDEIESEYQAEKIVSTETTVGAEITDVECIYDQDGSSPNQYHLTLSVYGGPEYTVSVAMIEPQDGNDILRLYEEFGIQPNERLSELHGQRVKIESNDISAPNITLGSDEVVETMGVVTASDQKRAVGRMPAEAVNNIRRALEYRQFDPPVEVRINEVRVENNELVLVLQENWGQISIEKASYSDDSNSDYVRLIETVGQGSVKQIEGSYLFFAHESDFQTSLGTSVNNIQTLLRQDDQYVLSDGRWIGFADNLQLDPQNRDLGKVTAPEAGAVATLICLLIGIVFTPALFMTLVIGVIAVIVSLLPSDDTAVEYVGNGLSE
jgi:hypothetical protein